MVLLLPQESLFQPALKSSQPIVSERAKQSNDPMKRCRSLNFSYMALRPLLMGGIIAAKKPTVNSVKEAAK